MNNLRRTVFDTFKSEGCLSLQTLSSFLSFSFCFLSFHKNPLGLKLWNLGRTIEYFATFLLISTFLPTMSPAATEVVLSWLALAFSSYVFSPFYSPSSQCTWEGCWSPPPSSRSSTDLPPQHLASIPPFQVC